MLRNDAGKMVKFSYFSSDDGFHANLGKIFAEALVAYQYSNLRTPTLLYLVKGIQSFCCEGASDIPPDLRKRRNDARKMVKFSDSSPADGFHGNLGEIFAEAMVAYQYSNLWTPTLLYQGKEIQSFCW
ncbi:hypothetical protein CDAR_115901 [Caerostris darwini]|uniref:Uncharacterized protein n=1 Tax=Caerostris darwini TaxID=1538125 RepID=A0AAV4NBW9_9ARAC|nr:hypothetical protein CDAR_115901 [Caerostris darwini]